MRRTGMTLVEMLVTVSIVGMLSAILVPAVTRAMRHRENAQTASRMRMAVNAFELCWSEHGAYPPDKYPGEVPKWMGVYFADMGIDEWWSQKTPIGGRWDWDKDYHFDYSVSISGPTVSTKQLLELDAMLEPDRVGDLGAGKFRLVGQQYHYILKE